MPKTIAVDRLAEISRKAKYSGGIEIELNLAGKHKSTCIYSCRFVSYELY